MKKILGFLLLVILLLAVFNFGSLSAGKSSGKQMYVWVDSLNIRQEPSQTGVILEKVMQGDAVEYLDQKTGFKEKMTLHGRVFDEPWLKIKTYKNVGWAYGGALREEDPIKKISATAFPNREGTELVTVNTELVQGDRFKKVIGPGGLVYPIVYSGKKKQKSFTALSHQFNEYGGFYYKINNGKVKENDSCLLVTEEFFQGRKIIPFKPLLSKKCDSSMIKKIEGIKKWTAQDSWSLVEAGGYEFYLVLFERKGKKALACITCVSTEKIVIMDYPGEDSEDGTWRLGDEGQISPKQFDFLAVFETTAGIEFLMSGYGGEGINIYYEQELGNIFFPVIHDYRYTMN